MAMLFPIHLLDQHGPSTSHSIWAFLGPTLPMEMLSPSSVSPCRVFSEAEGFLSDWEGVGQKIWKYLPKVETRSGTKQTNLSSPKLADFQGGNIDSCARSHSCGFGAAGSFCAGLQGTGTSRHCCFLLQPPPGQECSPARSQLAPKPQPHWRWFLLWNHPMTHLLHPPWGSRLRCWRTECRDLSTCRKQRKHSK